MRTGQRQRVAFIDRFCRLVSCYDSPALTPCAVWRPSGFLLTLSSLSQLRFVEANGFEHKEHVELLRDISSIRRCC